MDLSYIFIKMKKKNVTSGICLQLLQTPKQIYKNTHFYFESICLINKNKWMIFLSYILRVKPLNDNLIGSLLYFYKNEREKMSLLGSVSNFYKSSNEFIKHSLLL